MTTDAFSDVGVVKGSTEGSDGAVWGLASLWLGAVALLAVPVTLIFNLLLWFVGQQAPRSNPLLVGVIFILMVLSVLIMLGLAGCGIAFGLKGRRVAHDNRQASPLALAGILVGGAAVIGWIIVSIDILMIFT